MVNNVSTDNALICAKLQNAQRDTYANMDSALKIEQEDMTTFGKDTEIIIDY